MAAPSGCTTCEEIITNSHDADKTGLLFDPDEWLFDSIKSYQKLHMFELIHQTKTIAWIEDRDICVGSFHTRSRNEIHQLSLPDSLTAQIEDCDSCSAKRDFSVRGGGFHNQPVECIQYLSDNRIISSDQCENCLRLWQLSDSETDVIKQKSYIQNPHMNRKAAGFTWQRNNPSRLVFGSSMQDLCLYDVTSEKVTSLPLTDAVIKSDIAFMKLLDSNELIICSKQTGALWVTDIREKCHLSENGDVTGTHDASVWTGSTNSFTEHAGNDSHFKVVKINNHGQIYLHDIRNLSKPYLQIYTKLEYQGHADICIQMAPLNSALLSVSGFDSCVHVYDTARLRVSEKVETMPAILPAGQMTETTPIFSHRGHAACCDDDTIETMSVLTHTWHPWQPNMILSSANDSSLHAWQFSLKS